MMFHLDNFSITYMVMDIKGKSFSLFYNLFMFGFPENRTCVFSLYYMLKLLHSRGWLREVSKGKSTTFFLFFNSYVWIFRKLTLVAIFLINVYMFFASV